jgi:cell division protein FtsB
MTHELDQSLRIHRLETENMALRAEIHRLTSESLIAEVERRLQQARPHAFNRRKDATI